MQQVILVPAGPLALAFDARFEGLVLPQHGQRQAVEQGQVLDPPAVAHAQAIFVEGEVQYPMQAFSIPQWLRTTRARRLAAGGRLLRK